MKNTIKQIIIAVSAALLAVFIYARVSDKRQSDTPTQTEEKTNTKWFATMPVAPSTQTDFTQAADKAIPAVVHVKVKVKSESQSSGNPIIDLLYGYGEPQVQEGSGSGVIISKEGFIVTNNHVIAKSKDIEVVLDDKRTYDAELIGTDPQTDLALLKINESNLNFLNIGNSDIVKVGEWVLAVGNPFSLSTTVTAGIVSAKGRGIGIISNSNNRMGVESFIQTDAVVNPGNSGGALVNTNGELIGINTAIASPTGAYAGYSFAVPVSIVKKVVADLMEFGEVQRALLGVQIVDISAELAEEENLEVLDGVYIAVAGESGAAAEAGIKKGDVVIDVNGSKVNSVSELQEQISRYRPGDKVSVDIVRNNKHKRFTVELKNVQGNTNVTLKAADFKMLGAEFKEISDNLKRRLNIGYGMQISSLASGKLMKHGIREGYIITKINNERILSEDDIKDAVDNAEDALFISGIYPNGRVAYYAINLTEEDK